MSYQINDRSVESGAPVEFYKFMGPFGEFRYTSDNSPGICNGELYIPIPGGISRTTIETSTVLDSLVTCDITIAASSELAKLYCYGKTPDELRLEVRAAHRSDDMNTDWVMEWFGFGLDTSTSGDESVIRTGSTIQAMLTGTIASKYYQRSCNHVLFDSRCKVNREDWTVTAVVTKIQASILTVEDTQAGVNALSGGQLIVGRTGESRSIYTNDRTELKLSYPLTDIVVGDEVSLEFGCDHKRLGDCLHRFDNVVNYGGFDFIPSVNPFKDLHFDSIVTTTIKEDIARWRATQSYTISNR